MAKAKSRYALVIERNYRSDARAAVHATTEDLYEAKVIAKTTMRKFDELCLAPEESHALRKREGVSPTTRRCRDAPR